MKKLGKCKQRIFDKAVELFSEKNYEMVSLEDISSSLNRTKPSIYAHYKSKQEILDTIYDFFCERYCSGRPTMEELEPILKDGSPSEMIAAITHNHVENIVNSEQMMQITKIIYQRTFCDDRAHEIAKSLMMDSTLRYVETAFNRAIELGRFKPFDTHIIASVLTNSRFCMIRNWLLSPTDETLKLILEEERALDKYASLLLIKYHFIK